MPNNKNEYDAFNVALGLFLKKHRESNNMTIEELGKSIGRSKSWYYDIERGKNNIFHKDMIALCKVLGCSIDDANEFINQYIDSL